jgi:hypothetical protein
VSATSPRRNSTSGGRRLYTNLDEVKPEEILVLAVVHHGQASDRWQNRR